MNEDNRLITIICAEDDAEDRMFIKDAWEESLIRNKLEFVEDGEEFVCEIAIRELILPSGATRIHGYYA